jgi:hypothetical protein
MAISKAVLSTSRTYDGLYARVKPSSVVERAGRAANEADDV